MLAALRLRDVTGEGQWIDLSMLEAMLATDDYAHYSLERLERTGAGMPIPDAAERAQA